MRRDAAGALRVGPFRVLLELVIRAFQDGATPETIVQRYPSAALADIYAAIAYYLRHRANVEAYLAECEQQAQEVRHRIEGQQGIWPNCEVACWHAGRGHVNDSCCVC